MLPQISPCTLMGGPDKQAVLCLKGRSPYASWLSPEPVLTLAWDIPCHCLERTS